MKLEERKKGRKMNNYNFETLEKELNERKARAVIENKRKKSKLKLRKWVWAVLYTVVIAFITITIYQLFNFTTIHTTPVGTYQCKGKIIQICHGNQKVKDYLGG